MKIFGTARTTVIEAKCYVERGWALCKKDPLGLVAMAGLFAIFDVSSIAFAGQNNIAAYWLSLALPWVSIVGGNLALILAIEALAEGELIVPAKILPQTWKFLRKYLEVNGITTLIFWGTFVPLKKLLDYYFVAHGMPDVLSYLIIVPLGLFVHVRLVFATYAVVVDKQSAVKAVATSWRVANDRWVLAVLTFVFSLIMVAPVALPVLILAYLSPSEIQNGLNWTVIQMIRPVLIATLHEMYVDLGPNGKIHAKKESQHEKLVELDVLKAIAILAVVLIHIISLSYGNFTKWAWSFESLFVSDQLMRFCVPMFVALSGFGLGMSNLNRDFSFGGFLKRRVWRLLPWYLVASLALWIFIRLSDEWEHVEHFSFFRIILEGKADYHLYFVPMIVQLYLLFPVIKWGLKRFGKLTVFGSLVLMMGVILMTTLDAEKYLKLPFAWGDQQQYLFFGSWIFYFVLGVYLNFVLNFGEKKTKLFRTLGLVFLGVGVVVTLVDGFRLLGLGADLIAATRFTRFSVLIYATGVIMAAFSYRKFFAKFPNIFVWIGERSYLIYLFHTLIIRVSLEIFKPKDMLTMVVFFLCVFMLSAALAEGLYRIGVAFGFGKKYFGNVKLFLGNKK